MTPSEYLDASKAALQIESDYALAKKWEVSRFDISEVRRGKQPMTPYYCARVAEALNLEPMRVLADVESQQEKNLERKRYWTFFLSERLKKSAAALVLMLSIFCGQPFGPGHGGLCRR